MGMKFFPTGIETDWGSPDNKRQSYDAMFSLLKMALECRGLKLSAEYFMSDFEIAIRDSFVNHFPQNEAKSCAFHFTKAKRSDNEEATNFGSKGEAPRGEKEKSIRRKYDKKFHPGCSLQEVSQFVENRSEKLSGSNPARRIFFRFNSKIFFKAAEFCHLREGGHFVFSVRSRHIKP